MIVEQPEGPAEPPIHEGADLIGVSFIFLEFIIFFRPDIFFFDLVGQQEKRNPEEKDKEGEYHPSPSYGPSVISAVCPVENQDAPRNPEFESARPPEWEQDRKSTRLNSSHVATSYTVLCFTKKKYCTVA